MGRLGDAEREFGVALRIRPNYAEARGNLERVRSMEAGGHP
jgi:hypothetical protein